MLLAEGIKQLIFEGFDIINYQTQFRNALMDINAFEGNMGYASIMRTLIEKELIVSLINDAKVNSNHYELIVNSFSNKLSNYSYKRKDVEYVLYSLLYGIGYIDLSVVPTSPLEESVQTFLGIWEFNYKENDSTTLTIKADGTAFNTSGTKYSWEIKEGHIRIYLNGMVSYGGRLINENRIEGYVTSELNHKVWMWNANRIPTQLSEKLLKIGKWKIVNNFKELDDDIVIFEDDGLLTSNNYGKGRWYIEDENLVIKTAKGVITYKFFQKKDCIQGKGWNSFGDKWNNCELIKII